MDGMLRKGWVMRSLTIGVCCLLTAPWLSVAIAQQQADEAGVVSTLRGIASGQLTYGAVCGDFFYAPTLAALARPQPGQKDGFILPSDVPPKGAAVLEKHHYRIEMTAKPSAKSPASCNGVPAGGSAETFFVTARPMPGYSGTAFRIDAEGKLTEIK